MALMVLLATGLLWTSPAAAQDLADSIVIDAEVAADGTLSVTQTISFADSGPAELEQRIATTRPGLALCLIPI